MKFNADVFLAGVIVGASLPGILSDLAAIREIKRRLGMESWLSRLRRWLSEPAP